MRTDPGMVRTGTGLPPLAAHPGPPESHDISDANYLQVLIGRSWGFLAALAGSREWRIQLVTSAEVKRAQAKEPNSSAYTANDSSPRSRVDVSTGARSRESKESHQWVGRYGPAAASCGTLSITSLVTTRIMTVAMAPIACSVNVEMASPMAPSAAIAAATYKVTNSSRRSPSGSETVAPDSRVTGPTGNSM